MERGNREPGSHWRLELLQNDKIKLLQICSRNLLSLLPVITKNLFTVNRILEHLSRNENRTMGPWLIGRTYIIAGNFLFVFGRQYVSLFV